MPSTDRRSTDQRSTDQRSSVRPGAVRPGSVRPSTVRPSTTGSIGLLLAGRYRLDERRGRDGDSSTWDGHDTQLERRVIIRVVSGAAVRAALEAARVVAAHHAPGLTRILDTGSARATDGTLLGWVVEERPAGDRLDELVRQAPLDGARARALIGQGARALELAARSGCHHRRLSPASLYVSGGSVVVSGLVVAAAAAGVGPTDEEDALAQDGQGLASLLYAALTGLWPHGRVDAVGAAPRSRGAAVAPHVLVAGVPPDLDQLLIALLSPSLDLSPTPGDLAASLLGPSEPTGDAATHVSAPGTTREIVLPDTQRVRGTRPATPPGLVAAPAGPAVPQGIEETPSAGSGGDGADTALPPGSIRTPDVASASHRDHLGRGPARRGSRRAAREARRAEEAATAQVPDGPVVRTDTPPAPAPAPAQARALGPLASDVVPPGAAPAAPGSVGGAIVRASRLPAPRDARSGPQVRSARSDRTEHGAVPRAVADASPSTARPPALPLIEPISPREVPGGSSHLRGGTAAVALALVAVLLVVALVIASRQVLTLQDLTGSVRDTGAASSIPSPTASDAAPAPATPSAEPAPTAAAPVIIGARALDPQGDGRENDDQAGNAADGDPSTTWTSDTYATAALGNLKQGVGVVLDLQAETQVHQVRVDVAGTGGSVEVRSSPQGTFEDSSVVAQAQLEGSTTIAVDPPVTTAHLVLWFTQLPSVSSGFRIELSDVALT